MLELTSLLEEAAVKASAHILPGFVRSIQTDAYSCGAHCAYAIMRYYGYTGSKRPVLKRLRNRDGLCWVELREFFCECGLEPACIDKPTLLNLRREIDAGFPVLVSMDTDHWATVYGYGRGCFYVMDSSLGRSVRCYHTTERFRKRWDRWAMPIRAS
jgi:ABC-type bacteriocin/lantibiotic exporter with double-glycine peptidase domain